MCEIAFNHSSFIYQVKCLSADLKGRMLHHGDRFLPYYYNYLHKRGSHHNSSITLQYLNLKRYFQKANGRLFQCVPCPLSNFYIYKKRREDLTEKWMENYYLNSFLLSSVKIKYLLLPLLAHKPTSIGVNL